VILLRWSESSDFLSYLAGNFKRTFNSNRTHSTFSYKAKCPKIVHDFSICVSRMYLVHSSACIGLYLYGPRMLCIIMHYLHVNAWTCTSMHKILNIPVWIALTVYSYLTMQHKISLASYHDMQTTSSHVTLKLWWDAYSPRCLCQICTRHLNHIQWIIDLYHGFAS